MAQPMHHRWLSAAPSGLNCPECLAPLYELCDTRLLRFRCRSGHAFSVQSLLSAQADAREDLLASLFSTLLDEATVARRMAQREECAADPPQLARLTERVATLEQEAERVQTLQRAMTGLVDPEPPSEA
jgi:two-component system, chemotaxis family, protein-glutamate methylesterase/glutaminase